MSYVSLRSVGLSRDPSEVSIHIADDSSPLLDSALNTVEQVLSTQAKAIAYLTSQYRKSQFSRTQMKKSLRIMNNGLNQGGKVVISGMGKSFKIAGKTVATMNSLSVQAAMLHPSEALHGDLGIIHEERGDVLVLVSASGNTPELINLLYYVPETVPVILMTCARKSKLSENPRVRSMLYADLPPRLSEKKLYGLSAPTISTTLCLTLLDATSMALAELYINDLQLRKKRFGDRHPGGAIGAETQKERASGLAKLATRSAGNGSTSASSVTTESSLSGKISAASAGSAASEEIIKEESEPEQDSEGELETIPNLALSRKIKESTAKVSVFHLPETELQMLSMLVTYDYLIVSGEKDEADCRVHQVVDCKQAQEIYRDAKVQGDGWSEILWKIQDVKERVVL